MKNEESRSLHVAAGKGDVPVVRALLDHGLDVNGLDDHGLTPLHYAVWGGNSEAALVLIERGANINSKRLVDGIRNAGIGNTWTPLHFAVENDHPECAHLLLEAGADPDPEDQYGQTPLMLAVEAIRTDAERVLIGHGANGRRVWAWAGDYHDGSDAEIIELLKSAGADRPKS